MDRARPRPGLGKTHARPYPAAVGAHRLAGNVECRRRNDGDFLGPEACSDITALVLSSAIRTLRHPVPTGEGSRFTGWRAAMKPRAFLRQDDNVRQVDNWGGLKS